MSEIYIIAKAELRLKVAGYSSLWAVNGPNGSTLRAFQKGGRVLIMHDSGENGFELYKPASPSNDVEKTLKAAGL